MPKAPFNKLQKTVDAVSTCQNPQEKMATLRQAFDLFSEETKKLETAYHSLKKEFQNVNLELQETNQKLHDKVAELDLVTYYLNSILSNISQGIIFLDVNGTVTTYNAAAENILKIEAKKVLFNSFWDNFADDLFGFSMRETISLRVAPGSTSTSLHERQLEIDTTFVLREKRNSPEDDIAAAEQTTQGLIVLILDMTEIRHLQALAERNDRMQALGEMAAMVAHEIRNPLGGIKGFASLLQRDLKEQPALEQLATYIVEGTDNLNRLVNNVLSYSRPLQMHFDQTDLVALMQDVILHVNADESVDPRIELRCKSSKESIMAMIDPQVFKSGILNLVSNAIQAMPDGGELEIETEQEGREIVIKVSDTGVGIPPENLKKIFSPFFTTRPDGHGFGLTEVHKVMQGHGGVIEVQSALGQGTTFIVRLPLKTSS